MFMCLCCIFFLFSSRRRHTRCALVTGVQTCALPIYELRETASDGALDISADVARLQAKSDKLLRDTYARLTPRQKTQVARHPEIGRASCRERVCQYV